MQTLKSIKFQLAQLGYRGRLLGRGEVLELPKILRANEQLESAVFGFNNGASVLLAATNYRLLLLNKRFYHCKCDEIPYLAIGQIENTNGVLASRIQIYHRGGELVIKGVPKTRAAVFVDSLEKKVERSSKPEK